jgi:hypothetical protein
MELSEAGTLQAHISRRLRLALRAREDARPAALFRIALAALVLTDIVTRLRDVTAFYTDLGAVSRTLALRGQSPVWHWSLFLFSGGRSAALLLFCAFLPAAIALLVGYRTRMATVACWVYLQSVQARNLYVCDSGDTVMRVLSFFAIFADLGAAFSADVLLGLRPRSATVPALPIWVLRFQIALLYLVAVSWKTGASWRGGTAVLRAMQNVDFARPLAAFLAAHPSLCAVGTYATLLLEAAFPFLALSTAGTYRAIAIALGLILHGSIFATMRVGVFSLALPASYLLLLDGRWLDRFRTATRIEVSEPRAPFSLAMACALALQMAFIVIDQACLRARTATPLVVRSELLLTGLWQHWNVFAPDPPDTRTTFRAPGILTDGAEVDVLAEVAPRMLPDRRFLYTRWYKYRSNLESGDPSLLVSFGQYLCRRYNTDRLPKLDRFTVSIHIEPMDLPDMPPRSSKEVELLAQPCFSTTAVSE